MTLQPGESWGELAHLPAETPVVRTDSALAEIVSSSKADVVVAALEAGDLCRTLGGRGDVRHKLGETATVVPIDVGHIRAGGVDLGLFVAHVVVRGRLWQGPTAVVMNAEWVGEWDVAPRAHPGDGRLDIIQGRLSLRERLIARRRVRSGDHIPHSDLHTSRSSSLEIDLGRARLVFVDGVDRGRHQVLTVELLPKTVLVAI